MAASSEPRALPPLHLVTDDAVLGAADFGERALAALSAGGRSLALHLRGPRTGGAMLYAIAQRLLPAARAAGALLLVNDRVDVALAAGADGVQLGRRGLLPRDARLLVGDRMLIGASVHSPAEAEAAGREPDFLLAGSLFASASHPGSAGSGTGWLAGLGARGSRIVGIGGITPDQVAEVRRAGAVGVAVLGGVWKAPDPARAVRDYLFALGEGNDE